MRRWKMKQRFLTGEDLVWLFMLGFAFGGVFGMAVGVVVGSI
jgi:hypothetical protein